MAMVCINGVRDCSGCMQCQEEITSICPVCSKAFELAYLVGNEIVGCEQCISVKSYDEVEELL